uniref:trypsin n=1 Tax=Erpetoichthys calabaricus TaxID=27687 RepID=A0A8C4TG00_ERPCA
WRALFLYTFICLLSLLSGVSGDKIIDGKEASPHSRPYMAILKIKVGYPCTAVEAAHCKGKNITVILGAHYRLKKEKSQQTIPVQEMIPHENYDEETIENDIMLLKLKYGANITDEVKTIHLPSTDEHFEPGTICSVAGWGHNVTHGKLSNVLREVDVKIQKRCDSASQICARGILLLDIIKNHARSYLFQGDSGGPLVCQGRNNIPTAAGIMSYSNSYNCEDAYRSDVYVKVSAYLKWIKTKIKVSSSA